MNRSSFLLATPAIVLTIAGCNSAKDSLPWQTYNSTAGKYSILVPGSPQEQAETKQIAGLTLQQHKFSIRLDNPEVRSAFSLSFLDYPAGSVARVGIEKVLDGPIERMRLPAGATLKYKKKITVDGAPGIEYQYQNGATYVTSRVIVQGDRFFQMSALTQQKQFDLGSDRKFLDSFELLK